MGQGKGLPGRLLWPLCAQWVGRGAAGTSLTAVWVVRTRASSMESERKGWGDVKDLRGTEPAGLGYWIDAESKEKGRLCVTLMIRP